MLLRIEAPPPGVPQPDELRIWIYADEGALWRNIRIPSEGRLVPQGPDQLGTVFVQSGDVRGTLRVHVRGLVSGMCVLDAVLAIAPTDRRGTIAVALQSVVPLDGDGDDVPDAIDDCPSAADPAQAGCPTDAPTAADAATDAAPAVDASVGEAGTDAGTAADAGARADAAAADAGGDGSDCGASSGCNRSLGSVCTKPAECGSGFCKDGVCCNTACANPCQTCGTGTCKAVTRAPDPPECPSPMTCNAAGRCSGS